MTYWYRLKAIQAEIEHKKRKSTTQIAYSNLRKDRVNMQNKKYRGKKPKMPLGMLESFDLVQKIKIPLTAL